MIKKQLDISGGWCVDSIQLGYYAGTERRGTAFVFFSFQIMVDAKSLLWKAYMTWQEKALFSVAAFCCQAYFLSY